MTRIANPQQDRTITEANEKNQKPIHTDECFFCRRGLTEKAAANGWWIHYSTNDNLISMDEGTPEDSQGFFAVGSECAKKVPVAYRTRLA